MFGIKVRAHGPAGGQVPPGQQHAPGTDIGPALLPIPASAAAAWQGRGQIHGAPGTIRIPAPAPFPGYDQTVNSLANEGHIGLPSSVLPYWYPSVYYQTDIPNVIPVETINSTLEMPVPAIRPNNMRAVRATNSPGGISPASGAFAARLGGQWPIGWPRVIASYPVRGAPS
jgi:hypothetical protein